MIHNSNNQKLMRISLLISFLCLFSVINLNGQIVKKTKMIGGDVDLYLETPSPIGFGFIIHPNYAYFPIENLAVGIQLDAKFQTRNGEHYTSLGLGPMVRYYVGNESLSAFGHLSYLAIVDFNNVTTMPYLSHIVFPGVGINYLLFPTVGLEGLLGIYLGQGEPTISFSLGFQFFIPPNIN